MSVIPGEEAELTFVAGMVQSMDELKHIREGFPSENRVLTAFDRITGKFQSQIDGVVIDTPDTNLNHLFNYWLKHQANMGSRWARVRHNGYRDLTSDCECLGVINPGVWLTFAVYSLLKERGRIGMPDEIVEFNDGSGASIYEHVKRSVDFLWSFKGLHGLIKIWAVLSDVSKGGKEIKAMEAVDKYLETELGTLVSWPAYKHYDPAIGTMTQKPAGVYENGGVYLHPSAWKLAADAIMKRNDKVREGIEKILPFCDKWGEKKCEPYIMCKG